MSVMCIISYSVFNEHWFFSLSQLSLRFCIGFTVTQALVCIPVKPIKWAQVDSNHRPRAYQARALTCWAMSPQLGWTRARTYFSLIGEFSHGPLLWAVLGFHQYWLLFRFFRILACALFPSLPCLSGQGDRFSVSLPWWRWWDSNPWPPACRAGALPTELHPHVGYPSSSYFVLLLLQWTFEWISYITGCLWKIPHLWGIFKCLPVFSRSRLPVMQARLTQNWTTTFLTPIWFRVGTRISRSP